MNLVAVPHASADAGVENDLSRFLYLNDEPQNVYPILEYKAIREEDRPSFLFDEAYPRPRVVEFYAHWCPHCQKFKPRFVEFAKDLQNVTSHLSVGVQIEVHAVSCVPNKKICNIFELGGYPSVLVFPARSLNYTEILPRKLSTALVLKRLAIDGEGYASDIPVETTLERSKKANHAKGIYDGFHLPHFTPRTQTQVSSDAHVSLDRLLRSSVFSQHGPLDQPARDALRRFLKILTRTLSSSSSMSPLVRKLFENFDTVFQSESQMLEILGSLDPPTTKSWSSSCRQHGTGYTCGLWSLFHIVTVGAVDWNVAATDAETRLSTIEVADSIRDVIEYFFLECDECRVHFLTGYDACEHDRCNRLSDEGVKSTIVEWKELPLWLYEVHNGVNTRLRRERIANHEVEDTSSEWGVQWPPVYECTTCWFGIGRWNEDQVYRFLHSTYGQQQATKPDLIKVASSRHSFPDELASGIVATKDRRLDDAPPQSLHPMPLSLLGFCSVVGGMLFKRKKEYDMKGRHKKEESLDTKS